MNHLSEEQLIELYYSQKEPEAARHLDACGECARAYEALQSDLADMRAIDPPARSAKYGEQVWQSIAGFAPVYSVARKTWYRQGLWLGLSSAAACGLLVAAAFYAGRLWEHQHRRPHQTIANSTAPAAPPQRVVVVVLSDHLDRSERLLVELKHANAGDAAMNSPLRDEARSLLAANHKCIQDAAHSGDPSLTKALDHLDQLLSRLANQPGGLNAAALARLQDEMNRDGLLFEVRVLRSRIPNRHVSQNGGTI
jgi:hypothetical protein